MLEHSAADIVLLQETGAWSPEQIQYFAQWVTRAGWKGSNTPAQPSQGERAARGSGGAAAAIRSHFAGVAPWPGTDDGQIVRGRATGIWVGGVMRGGLYVASVYTYVNRGLRYGVSPCENP